MGCSAALLAKKNASKFERAIAEVKSGNTYRSVSKKYNLSYSTLFRRANGAVQKNGRRLALLPREEGLIVSFLLKFAQRGMPLTQLHLREAIKIIVEGMPPARRQALPFKSDGPSQYYIRIFRKRHASSLSFCKPLRQEAKRFSAVNADVLTKHFSVLEKHISENDLDASRIFNLDEAGTTPEKDITGIAAARRLMPRPGEKDVKMPQFKKLNRVTMMPIVSAAGEAAPPLFVFKGSRVPFRTVLRAGRIVDETPISNLPLRSTVALRQENGGVDTQNFRNWANKFVLFVAELTANDRKVLLIYDGYRAHLSVEVLEIFANNNIVVYALPAHTSEKTPGYSSVLVFQKRHEPDL